MWMIVVIAPGGPSHVPDQRPTTPARSGGAPSAARRYACSTPGEGVDQRRPVVGAGAPVTDGEATRAATGEVTGDAAAAGDATCMVGDGATGWAPAVDGDTADVATGFRPSCGTGALGAAVTEAGVT